MNEFDDFDDPQLRSTLQRAAGQAPDLPAAFAAVSSRAARIRRRRTVVVAASSLGLVVAAVAIVARPLDHDVKVTPGTDVNHVSTTVPVTTSPTTPTPRPPAPPATPAVTNPIASGAPGDLRRRPRQRSGAVPRAGTNAAGNETRTYSSEGGSVTVRLQNGAVRIVAGPSPRGGFQASVSDRGPDRVRVEFATSGHRSRITVTVQDGHLVAGSASPAAAPTTRVALAAAQALAAALAAEALTAVVPVALGAAARALAAVALTVVAAAAQLAATTTEGTPPAAHGGDDVGSHGGHG